MPVAENMRDALDLTRLELPASPKVVAIEVEDYVDWSGDDALRVYVILSDDTDEFRLTGDEVLQLKSAIRYSLRSHGIELFPYVRLVKESERRAEPLVE